MTDIADGIATQLTFDTGLLGLGACDDIVTDATAPGTCASYNGAEANLTGSDTEYAVILDIDSDVTPSGLLFDYAGDANTDDVFFFEGTSFADPTLTVDLDGLIDVSAIFTDVGSPTADDYNPANGAEDGDIAGGDTIYIIYNAVID